MIEVKNLTKIYTNGKEKLKALNSVSFKLPDKGMVFIVGKSGSGKSTLLNMLGGLDDITSGDVFVDNLNLSKMTNHELDIYRNHYLGIIYQNYNLFESETIVSNIKAGADALGIHIPDDEIHVLLKDLDLEDATEKKVKNLSGGQKQRVAIARALAKNPRLILADEPTGNLDTKTAKIIFDVLKKISVDRLVIVISHDNKSAHEYADRILRLSDGEVVEDLIRNKHRSSKLDKDFIYIDEDEEVSEAEIEEINKAIENSPFKLKKQQKVFVDFNGKINKSDEKLDIEKKNANLKKAGKTALKILGHNKFSLIVTILLSVLMISLLTLATSFIAFKGDVAVGDATTVRDMKCLVMKSGYAIDGSPENIKKDFFIEVDDSDLKPVKDVKYEGNVYPIINVGLPTNNTKFPDAEMKADISYAGFYTPCALGVVVCDENYISRTFGKDYEILAGSLYGLDKSVSLIATDYFADSLLESQPSLRSDNEYDPYYKLIGVNINNRFEIGAIVKTNYKEKYKEFYKAHEYVKKNPEFLPEFESAITASPLYQILEDDLNSYLNYCYSLNPNFQEDYKKYVDQAFIGYTFISTNEFASTNEMSLLNMYQWGYRSEDLSGDAISVTADFYNSLFGTEIVDEHSEEFQEKTIYFHNFSIGQDTSDPAKYVVKMVIKYIHAPRFGETFIFSQEKFEEVLQFNEIAYGYVFDNVNESYKIYNALKPYLFYTSLYTFDAVFNAINVISIFEKIFLSIFFVLLAILTLIVVVHSFKMMKKERYRFGVYKSLGYSTAYLNVAVIIANLFMVIIIFGFSIGLSFGLSFMTNTILQNGFYHYTKNGLYHMIRLLTFRFDYACYFNLITFVIVLVSTLIPLLKIRKIKPNNIIKDAD